MVKIGIGSFAPQRRKENAIVSELADQGLLLNGHVTVETISAFALTRSLNPALLILMYKQAGLLPLDTPSTEHEHFASVYRSQQ